MERKFASPVNIPYFVEKPINTAISAIHRGVDIIADELKFCFRRGLRNRGTISLALATGLLVGVLPVLLPSCDSLLDHQSNSSPLIQPDKSQIVRGEELFPLTPTR